MFSSSVVDLAGSSPRRCPKLGTPTRRAQVLVERVERGGWETSPSRGKIKATSYGKRLCSIAGKIPFRLWRSLLIPSAIEVKNAFYSWEKSFVNDCKCIVFNCHVWWHRGVIPFCGVSGVIWMVWYGHGISDLFFRHDMCLKSGYSVTPQWQFDLGNLEFGIQDQPWFVVWHEFVSLPKCQFNRKYHLFRQAHM